MRVELDLPDWVDERHIRIMAGIELVASKMSHEDFWRVKETRCNQCGICCMNLKPNHIYPIINGRCVHLREIAGGKYECNYALYRSRACGNDPQKYLNSGECCITYKICK